MKVLLSAYNLYDVAFENNPKTIRVFFFFLKSFQMFVKKFITQNVRQFKA